MLILVIVGSMITIGSQTYMQASNQEIIQKNTVLVPKLSDNLETKNHLIDHIGIAQSRSARASNRINLEGTKDSITQIENFQIRNPLLQDTTPQSEPNSEEEGWFTERNGIYFEILNSEYLNITLTSSEPVYILLESVPRAVSFIIENITAAQATTLTLSGFEPNATYYRYEEGYSKGMFTTSLTGEYSFVQDISRSNYVEIVEQESTIYINSDGTINPATAPISRDGDIYTFTDNIYERINIYRDNIIIDGNGYTLQGTGPGSKPSGSSSIALWLRWRNNITIQNIIISGWGYGIWIFNTVNSLITNNVITDCWNGIDPGYLKNTNITYNDVRCVQYGLRVWYCRDGYVYHNNFIGENYQWGITYSDTTKFYHPELLEGNYWSAYIGLDDGSGTDKHEIAGDGIGDTNLPWPYSWYKDYDSYPFMEENGWKSSNTAPTADAGGPYEGDEGAVITFDASASSDPENNILEYRWDFSNDGTWDTTWSTSPYSEFTWYDDFSGEAKVEVSDGEFIAIATAVVTVNNVVPSVGAGADQTVNEDEVVFFSSSFSDPGVDDTHTFTWDFGNGTIQPGTLTPTKVYPNPGVYTVTLTVTDDDGGIGIDTLIVTVLDITPPETELTIDMYYIIDDIVYITSDTQFTLSATDFSGVGHTYYTISGSEWIEYDLQFSIIGLDGVYTISFYSIDIFGNAETPQFVTVLLVNLEVNSYLTDGESNLLTYFDVVFRKYKSEIFNYKLVATNPGQIFYNIEVKNEWFIPIEILTISPSIPEDFILKGANPIHIYLDGVDVTKNCLIEGTSITITNVPVTSSVLVYIHLDYALKGSHYVTLDEYGMKNYIFDVNTAGSVGTPSLPGNGLVGTYSAPRSLFTTQKKTTAFAGFITDLEGNPIVKNPKLNCLISKEKK